MMPGFYQPGEYDVSGTIVGVVEKSEMLTGKAIKPGDVLIGLASSGLHTNGYSLARKIFFDQMKLTPQSALPGLKNRIGDELLKVHVSYGPLVQSLLKKFNPQPSRRSRAKLKPAIKGLAHITGGGFVDNIPRVLPRNCNAIVRRRSWEPLPIFRIIQEQGCVPEKELYQVFNMGIGMIVIAAPSKAESILRFILSGKQKAWIIGEVTKGRGEVELA
jgi:phosphoribosylformylglycinamidine cyclo-ligase